MFRDIDVFFSRDIHTRPQYAANRRHMPELRNKNNKRVLNAPAQIDTVCQRVAGRKREGL